MNKLALLKSTSTYKMCQQIKQISLKKLASDRQQAHGDISNKIKYYIRHKGIKLVPSYLGNKEDFNPFTEKVHP